MNQQGKTGKCKRGKKKALAMGAGFRRGLELRQGQGFGWGGT